MLSALAKYIFGGMMTDAPETTTMQYETREINDWLLVDMPDQAIDNEDMNSESDEDDILTAVPLLMVEEASICPRQIVLSYEDKSACDKTYGKIRKNFHDKIHSATSKVQVHSGDKIQGNFVDNNETVSIKFQDNFHPVHSKMQDNSSEVQENSRFKNSRSRKSKPKKSKKSKKHNKSEVLVENTCVSFKESSNHVQEKANDNVPQDFNEKSQSTTCEIPENLIDEIGNGFVNKLKDISIVNNTNSFNMNQDAYDTFQENSNFMKSNVKEDFIVNIQKNLDQKMQSDSLSDPNLCFEVENYFMDSHASFSMPIISGINDRDCDDEIFISGVKKFIDEISGKSSNKIKNSAGEGQKNYNEMQSESSTDYKLCKDKMELCKDMDECITVSDMLDEKCDDEIPINDGKNLIGENSGKCNDELKNSDDEVKLHDKIQNICCEFKGNSKKPNSKKYRSKKAKKNRMQNKFNFKFQDPSATNLDKYIYNLQENPNEKFTENLSAAICIPTEIPDFTNKDVVIEEISADAGPEFYKAHYNEILEDFRKQGQNISSLCFDVFEKSNGIMQDISNDEIRIKSTDTSENYDKFGRNSSNCQGNLSNIHCNLYQVNKNSHSEKESNFANNKVGSTKVIDNIQNKYQDSFDFRDNSDDRILEHFADFWNMHTKIQVNSEDVVQQISDDEMNEDFDREQSDISDEEINKDFDREQSDISDEETNEDFNREQSDISDDELNKDFDREQSYISDDEINEDFDKEESDISDDEINEDSEHEVTEDEINENSEKDREDYIEMRCKRLLERLSPQYYCLFKHKKSNQDQENKKKLDNEIFQKGEGKSNFMQVTRNGTILELVENTPMVIKHNTDCLSSYFAPQTKYELAEYFNHDSPSFYKCQSLHYPSSYALAIVEFCAQHEQFIQGCPPFLCHNKCYNDTYKQKYEETIISEKLSPSISLDSSLLTYSAELLQNITNQKCTALPTKTAVVLEHVKQLKPEQQAIQFETRKYLTRSQLNRQNRNYIYQSSVKTNRRRNLQRNHSGANNNRKCC